MRFLTLLIVLSAASASAAEVSFRVRHEPVSWLVDPARYSEPSSQWLDDSTLLVQAVLLETGSFAIRDSGASVNVSEDKLTLRFVRCPIYYSPEEPIPSSATPVLAEWRVTGLARAEYKISLSAAEAPCN